MEPLIPSPLCQLLPWFPALFAPQASKHAGGFHGAWGAAGGDCALHSEQDVVLGPGARALLLSARGRHRAAEAAGGPGGLAPCCLLARPQGRSQRSRRAHGRLMAVRARTRAFPTFSAGSHRLRGAAACRLPGPDAARRGGDVARGLLRSPDRPAPAPAPARLHAVVRASGRVRALTLGCQGTLCGTRARARASTMRRTSKLSAVRAYPEQQTARGEGRHTLPACITAAPPVPARAPHRTLRCMRPPPCTAACAHPAGNRPVAPTF